MSNVNLSKLNSLFNVNTKTDKTKSTSSNNSSKQESVNFNEEYKSSISDLNDLLKSGVITQAEYNTMKSALDNQKNIQSKIFDSNNDGLLSGFELDLYNDYKTSYDEKDKSETLATNQYYYSGSGSYWNRLYSNDLWGSIINPASVNYNYSALYRTELANYLNNNNVSRSFLESDAYKQIKDMYDKGLLSLDEFTEAFKNNYTEWQNKTNFDTNKDGVLDAAEKAAMSYDAEVRLEKFMDKDGDKTLSENEQAAVDAYNDAIANPDSSVQDKVIKDLLTMTSDVTEKVELYNKLSSFDYDGDGKLNYAEYKALEAYENPPKKQTETKVASTPAETVPTTTVTPTTTVVPTLITPTTTVTTPATPTVSTTPASTTGAPATTTSTTTSSSSGLNTDVEVSAETMKRFDYNGDGNYDAAELAALQAYLKSEQNAKLDAKIDINGDGNVEQSEIAAMRTYINAEKAKGNNSTFIQKMDARLEELAPSKIVPLTFSSANTTTPTPVVAAEPAESTTTNVEVKASVTSVNVTDTGIVAKEVEVKASVSSNEATPTANKEPVIITQTSTNAKQVTSSKQIISSNEKENKDESINLNSILTSFISRVRRLLPSRRR